MTDEAKEKVGYGWKKKHGKCDTVSIDGEAIAVCSKNVNTVITDQEAYGEEIVQYECTKCSAIKQ